MSEHRAKSARLPYGVPESPYARDSVDRLLLDWARERPDLDFSPVGIIVRLARLRARIDAELTAVFAGYDLTPADFAVVVTLRRAGEPYEMPQARLMDALALTSGTVSVRLDRLQRRGVVERTTDPANARASIVRLTHEGLRLFDQVAPIHLANEDRLLSALTDDERATLADLLRRLNADFEVGVSDAAADLGLRVETAHAARRRRGAVGLSEVAGLLVVGVEPESAAAAAGVERGDLLLQWNDVPLTSTVELARQACGTAAGETVRLRLARGDRARTVTVTAPPTLPRR